MLCVPCSLLVTQMGVLAQERDSLKKILASYDAEEAEVIARAKAHWQGRQQEGGAAGEAGASVVGIEAVLTPEKSKQARLQVRE